MRIQFIAGFASIVRDPAAAKALYVEGLGLDFEGGDGADYVFTDKLDGAKHFGLWPLHQAAQSCFGKPEWPKDLPVPHASIEFEVDDVAAAADELTARGYELVHPARTEPWKQVIARLLTPEGLLIGICYTPWLHEGKA